MRCRRLLAAFFLAIVLLGPGSTAHAVCLAGVLAETHGGTCQSAYTTGDILYASAANTLAKLPAVASGSILVSAGVATAPAWSASPTLATSLTTSLVIGGTGTGSTLTLRSTSGVGATDALVFQVGNNGGIEAMRIATDGTVLINTTTLQAGYKAVFNTSSYFSGTNANFQLAGGKVGGNAYLFQTLDSNGSLRIYDQTNAATALTILQGTLFVPGNVGLNQTAPTARLDVKGTGTGEVLIGNLVSADTYGAIGLNNDLSTANYHLASLAGDGTLLINRPTGKHIQFKENNTTVQLYLQGTSGNLGLGVTPGAGKARLFAGGGTAVAVTDWAPTGWGASATISAVTGADMRGTVTVTTNVADTASANPILTLTFKDGTWTTVPFCVANMQGAGTTGPIAAAGCGTAAATMSIMYIGTPTALSSKTYQFNYHVEG